MSASSAKEGLGTRGSATSPGRTRAPRRTRATVTCGRNVRRSASCPTPASSGRGHPRLQLREAPGRVAHGHRQHVRAPRRQPQRLAQRDLDRAVRARRDELADPRRLLVVARPEEHEREVQPLRRDRPQPGHGVGTGRAPTRRGPRAPRPGCRRRRRAARLRRRSAPARPRRAAAGARGACATVVERSRTSARPPGSVTERVSRRPSRWLTDSQTNPTGLPSVPPPGPAMPVTPTPTSASSAARAPSASASATSSDTAPCARDQLADRRPRGATFAALEYTTRPPRTSSEEPARSVSRAASSPPVQDSATAIVCAGPGRAAARGPARRPCCRRRRTASAA